MAYDPSMLPHGEDYLVRRIKDLERRVDELAAADPLRTAGLQVGAEGLAVDSGLTVNGDLRVMPDGELTMQYPTDQGGNFAVYFGELYLGTIRRGTGLIVQEASGLHAFEAYMNESGTEHTVLITDNEGTAVVSVLAANPRGLDRPSFQPNMTSSDYNTWGGTDSATFANVAEGDAHIYSPVISVKAIVTTDASDTTGEVRFLLNGLQIGSTQSVGFSIAPKTFGPVNVPSSIPITTLSGLELQCRRTAGTGKVRGTVRSVSLQGQG